MIIPWNQIYSNGNEINDDIILNTLLFTDDHILLSDSEDNVQRALYTLHTTEQFGMEISPLKSKVMAFKRQVPIRCKTVIYNKRWGSIRSSF
jgi:hypothetical protein